MGGIISGIGSLFGGSSAKTDRKTQLAGMGDLANVFNYALPTAKTGERAGAALEGKAGDYYSKLLSGDRAAAESAVAPVATAAGQQTDAAKRQLATSGTARGGGVNAATQQLETSRRAAVDQAINEGRAGAASGAARLGGQQVSEAQNLLGLGTGAAESLTSEAGKSRKTSQELHDAAFKKVGDSINSILDVAFGGDSTLDQTVQGLE